MKRFFKFLWLILIGIAATIFFIGILGSVAFSTDITLAIKIALGSPLLGAILVSMYSVYYNWNMLRSGKDNEVEAEPVNDTVIDDIAKAQLDSPVQSKREDFI